ncbi:uncharacterized protein LOC143297996 [Babylonia areolata]|uniref:uncharacterized protein LOC143297996 n=1 Tax=Babylonia areolata TaxID=304850 RepID=UPI003FD519F7
MADDNTLWVGGLADEVTEDHLYELFLQAGPLEKVVRPKDKDGTCKKFAFVEFRHAESVPYAIQVMDGVKLFNHHLRLKGRTGSQHDSSRSDSPSTLSHSHSDRGHSSFRGGPEYHRSRSFHGVSRSMSGEERRGPHPLSQPFSSSGAYGASNMQPQSFEERRNRLLHKQNMSLGAYSQMQGGHHQYGSHNYAQSFSGYGQQQGPQQQWYLNNY